LRRTAPILALLILVGCRDTTSFAPNVLATPIPSYQFNGVLATFNNIATGSKLTNTLGAIQVNKDNNSTEYPGSPTMATLSTILAGSGGVGSGRALEMAYTLELSNTPFAYNNLQPTYPVCFQCPCLASPGAYAYVALTLQFVSDGAPNFTLSGFKNLTFWIRSPASADMAVTLDGTGEPRPLDLDGYLDAALTVKNPCWVAGKSEMGLPGAGTITIQGGNTWVQYTLPLSSFSDTSSQGMPASSPTMSCNFTTLRSLTFTFTTKASLPSGLPNTGTIDFDDVVFK
jgi:hypothetical protein